MDLGCTYWQHTMTQTKQESGVALIIVLGIVALLSTWAINALYEDQVSLRRAENQQDDYRAALANQSALNLAVGILKQDASGSKTDHLDELWARPMPPFPIDHGSIQARIIDANRMINLNSLVDAQGKAIPRVVRYVQHLFQQQGLDPQHVLAIVDWIDADHQAYGRGGSEAAAYLAKPYMIKNAALDRWQELLMIQGITQTMLRQLQGLLCVAPPSCKQININTASIDVLMAIAPKLSLPAAKAWTSQRPFASVANALQAQPWASNVQQEDLDVRSHFFFIESQANFGNIQRREQFSIERQQKSHVLAIERLQSFHQQAQRPAFHAAQGR